MESDHSGVMISRHLLLDLSSSINSYLGLTQPLLQAGFEPPPATRIM